jgi:hypothetical protein
MKFNKEIVKTYIAYIVVILLLIIYVLWSINYVIRYTQGGSYQFEINQIINDPNFKKKIEITNKSTELLNTKLCDLYINSSHNSYTLSTQHFSYIYPKRVYEVLESGARVIEIDVKYLNGKFYVCHGNTSIWSTNKYPLEYALDQVLKFSYTTSDPIFIMFEISVPDNTRLALGKLIKNKLSTKFLDDKYKFKNNRNYSFDKDGDYSYEYKQQFINIEQLKLYEFINKIVIMNVTSPRYLEDVIDSYSLINTESSKDIYPDTSNRSVKRAYPTPTLATIYSYNVDPTIWWNNKYNMVALNFQANDYFQYLNTLKFKDCSFVPMPKYDNSTKKN